MVLNDGSNEVLCPDALSCFFNVLSLGLREDGGVANAILREPYLEGSYGAFIARVIFDLTFFMIMIILLLNLIFGMIIDAFGEIRDLRSKSLNDQ